MALPQEKAKQPRQIPLEEVERPLRLGGLALGYPFQLAVPSSQPSSVPGLAHPFAIRNIGSRSRFDL
jgi:hypothetical protein